MSGETGGPSRALGASDPRHLNRPGGEAFDTTQFEYDAQYGRRIKPIPAITDATADNVADKLNALLAALRERNILES